MRLNSLRLLVAKALVDKCLRDWSADASDNIKALITGAFDVDSKGELNTAKILGLRKVDIQDANWLKAMEAISDWSCNGLMPLRVFI